MALIPDLLYKAPNLSAASNFSILNGIFYMATGSLFIFWPGSVQTLFQDPPFVGNEQALFRVIGMAVAVIGWLYFLEDAPAFVNSSPHLSSTELFWSQPYCCHCSSPESSLIP